MPKPFQSDSTITRDKVISDCLKNCYNYFENSGEDFFNEDGSVEEDYNKAFSKIINKCVDDILVTLTEQDWVKLINDSEDENGIAYRMGAYYNRYTETALFNKVFKSAFKRDVINIVTEELSKEFGTMNITSIRDEEADVIDEAIPLNTLRNTYPWKSGINEAIDIDADTKKAAIAVRKELSKRGYKMSKNSIKKQDFEYPLRETKEYNPRDFKSGMKVKLAPDYADEDPNEIFTLTDYNSESGKGHIADEDGFGWGVSYWQIIPADRIEEEEEEEEESTFNDVDEILNEVDMKEVYEDAIKSIKENRDIDDPSSIPLDEIKEAMYDLIVEEEFDFSDVTIEEAIEKWISSNKSEELNEATEKDELSNPSDEERTKNYRDMVKYNPTNQQVPSIYNRSKEKAVANGEKSARSEDYTTAAKRKLSKIQNSTKPNLPEAKKKEALPSDAAKSFEEKGTAGSLTAFAKKNKGWDEKAGHIKKSFLQSCANGNYGEKIRKKAQWALNMQKESVEAVLGLDPLKEALISEPDLHTYTCTACGSSNIKIDLKESSSGYEVGDVVAICENCTHSWKLD